jgi:hypothetical protein
VAACGLALAATPWLTWYTGFDDGGAYSDDGWMAFKGVSLLVVAAGLAGVAVAALPALWARFPRVVSRLPTLLGAIAAVAVARHISTGPNDGGPTDPTAAVYLAAVLAAAVAVGSFLLAQVRK